MVLVLTRVTVLHDETYTSAGWSRARISEVYDSRFDPPATKQKIYSPLFDQLDCCPGGIDREETDTREGNSGLVIWRGHSTAWTGLRAARPTGCLHQRISI